MGFDPGKLVHLGNILHQLVAIEPGIEGDPSAFVAMGKLGGEPVARVIGAAGRDPGPGDVEAAAPGLLRRKTRAADQARFDAPGIGERLHFGIDAAGSSFDEDGALGQVAEARRGDPADHLDPLDRRGGDPAEVDATARGGREGKLSAGAEGLQVCVVRCGNAVEHDLGTEGGKLAGIRLAGPDAGGVSRRDGNSPKTELLD